MKDIITISGLVATEPKHITPSEGPAITSFRLASSQRRFNRATGGWEELDTNWYTVTAFRRLAINAMISVHKGDRVLVTGRMRLREWQTTERTGMSVEVEADSIGHDLNWGSSEYRRTGRPEGEES